MDEMGWRGMIKQMEGDGWVGLSEDLVDNGNGWMDS